MHESGDGEGGSVVQDCLLDVLGGGGRAAGRVQIENDARRALPVGRVKLRPHERRRARPDRAVDINHDHAGRVGASDGRGQQQEQGEETP